jgi:hypothetical protein
MSAEKPNLQKGIQKGEAEAAKVRAAPDRYFEAFKAGTLEAELCNQKVRDLRAGPKKWRPRDKGWNCRDRRTIEARYALLNCRRSEDWNNWLAKSNKGCFAAVRRRQSD